jgi:hypothetical protein
LLAVLSPGGVGTVPEAAAGPADGGVDSAIWLTSRTFTGPSRHGTMAQTMAAAAAAVNGRSQRSEGMRQRAAAKGGSVLAIAESTA